MLNTHKIVCDFVYVGHLTLEKCLVFLLNIFFDARHLHRTVWLDSKVVKSLFASEFTEYLTMLDSIAQLSVDF